MDRGSEDLEMAYLLFYLLAEKTEYDEEFGGWTNY
jgi:hypothetical protein